MFVSWNMCGIPVAANEPGQTVIDEVDTFTALLISVLMKSIFFWDMTPCSALSGTRRFGGTCHLLTRCFAELFYDPEDRGDTFLRNVGYHSTYYKASYPRRRYSSKPPL
jgi:hypothetical protein